MLYVHTRFLFTANKHIKIETDAHLKYLALRLFCFLNDAPDLYFY